MREVMLKLTMDYKMTKHMLNSCTLKESRTWLLVCTRRFYFIPFNHEHPVVRFDPLLDLLVHKYWIKYGMKLGLGLKQIIFFITSLVIHSSA